MRLVDSVRFVLLAFAAVFASLLVFGVAAAAAVTVPYEIPTTAPGATGTWAAAAAIAVTVGVVAVAGAYGYVALRRSRVTTAGPTLRAVAPSDEAEQRRKAA